VHEAQSHPKDIATALLAAGGCGDSGGANQIDAPPTDKIGNRSKLKEFGEKAEAAKSLKSNKRR